MQNSWNTWLTIVILSFYSISLFSLQASVSFATFKTSTSPYVEFYVQIFGNSVSFVPGEDHPEKFRSAVEVLILIKEGDRIIQFDRAMVHSPVSDKPTNYSYVKRMAVPEGIYSLEVELSDFYLEGNVLQLGETLEIDFRGNAQLSDIQLLAHYTKSDESSEFVKNGYFMENIPFHYYNKKYNTMSFYLETYHDNTAEEHYILRFTINKLKGSGEKEEKFTQYRRRSVRKVDPVLFQIDIAKIESGDYYLNVAIVDPQKQVISEKDVFFIRSNPEYDLMKMLEYEQVPEDQRDFTAELDSAQLRYYLRALVPVIPQTDAELLKIIVSEKNVNAMRLFLYNHFEDKFPDNPGFAFKKYMDVAGAVDKKYNNGFGFGFETDRGYYFLKYGKPDFIQEVIDDPSAPPYEIWFYNSIQSTNQSNVRFVFYNPSLVENGHVLLHSTARGEWNNPQWEIMLYRNAAGELEGGNTLDQTRMPDNWGRHARRFYDDY